MIAPIKLALGVVIVWFELIRELIQLSESFAWCIFLPVDRKSQENVIDTQVQLHV